MPVRTRFDTVINEKTSAELTGVIKDKSGPLAAGSIATLTLTLYNDADGAIINSRNQVNVLNANGGTVDGSGNLAMQLLPADNVLVEQGIELEKHVALFEWTYPPGTPTDGGSHEIELVVCNLLKVT